MNQVSGTRNYNPLSSAPDAANGRERAAIPAGLAGLRLDQALAEMFPLHSRSRLQAWLKAGSILVDGAPAAPRRKVWGGERIELCVPEPSGASVPSGPSPHRSPWNLRQR
jgi:23S rRNA pseudouridine1911/1915/1917 synthase